MPGEVLGAFRINQTYSCPRGTQAFGEGRERKLAFGEALCVPAARQGLPTQRSGSPGPDLGPAGCRVQSCPWKHPASALYGPHAQVHTGWAGS